MDVRFVNLSANIPQTLFTATSPTIALKLWCDRGDAILKITIGNRAPKFLGISSWNDTRHLTVNTSQAFVIESNVAAIVSYQFQDIEINYTEITPPESSFSWDSTTAFDWNESNGTVWNSTGG